MLAHGWTERLTLWGPVIALLRGRGMRVVAYDLRGHGSSELAADGDYAIERFGDDVEAVLRATGAPACETIVAGHSLGGMSIAAWAVGHDVGERVAGAVILNAGLDDLIGGALVFGELGTVLSPRWLGRALLGSPRRCRRCRRRSGARRFVTSRSARPPPRRRSRSMSGC